MSASSSLRILHVCDTAPSDQLITALLPFENVVSQTDGLPERVDSPARLNEISGSESILVLYQTAEEFVPQKIAAGHDLAASIELWREYAVDILSWTRRHRKSGVLASAQATTEHPAECIRAAAEHFSILLGDALEAAQSSAPGKGPIPSWQQMAAKYAIEQDPDLLTLAAELEANALPIAMDPPNPARVFDEILELASRSSSTNNVVDQSLTRPTSGVASGSESATDLADQVEAKQAEIDALKGQLIGLEKELREERQLAAQVSSEEVRSAEKSLLIEQFKDVQHELTEQYMLSARLKSEGDKKESEKKAVSDALSKAKHEVARLEGILRDGEKLLASKSNEVRKAWESAKSKQEAIDASNAQARDLENLIADLKSEIAARDAAIEELHRSTSWRVTKPLRGVKRALSPQGSDDD